MEARLSSGRRLATALTWPVGIAVTSWHYMWRTTPMHRSEVVGDGSDLPPPLSDGLRRDDLQLPPTEFARFHKVDGASGPLEVNDELLVHMPGPWNGPVRVAEVTPTSLRYATLEGHLEAGQIEFRAASSDGELRFRVESWARSGDRLSNLLHEHLRMAKEVQLHMWSSFLERVVRVAGGRLSGGILIETRRLDEPDAVV